MTPGSRIVVAEVRPEVLGPGMSRSDLADVFNREHGLAVEAFNATVMHAIRAGEALLAAKDQTKPGEWTRWLKDVFVASPETANVYMQLAHAQEQILANPNVQSISQARRYLRELGMVREQHGSHGRGVYVSEAIREEARALHSEGMTLGDIATQLGFAVSTVHGWIHPESIPQRRARQRRTKMRRKAVAMALRDKERDGSIRKVAGPVSEAHSLGRKLAQHLQRAMEEADDIEVKNSISRALDAYARLGDAIWEAHTKGAA
jgi:hypothetical protein